MAFLIADFVILACLYTFIKFKQSPKYAREIYIWSNLITIGLLLATTASPHYFISLPIFIFIAAFILQPRSFLMVVLYSFVGFLAFAAMKAANGSVIDLTPSLVYWKAIDTFIMLTAGVYTGWQTSSDFQFTLKRLHNEIQEVSKSHSDIETLVNFDPLTGLVNRDYCKKLYIELFNKCIDNDESEQITVLFLDLDNFKLINDGYDHGTGDQVLIKIAERLKALTQTGGISCRLSGDEFVVIIKRPIHYDLSLFAKKILQTVATPIETDNHLIDLTVSIGVAVADKDDTKFNKIRKKADLAMYRAKKSGKNSFFIYNDEMYQASLEKTSIKKNLKKALRNGDLELYLQPKVNLSSGKINSAEALLRWTHNNEGNFGPAKFIPFIESTELICEIGEWVIHRACQLCKELHNKGYTDMSVAVNVSASQLIRGDLESIIKRELELSQLPPKFLEIELTEYSVFHDDDHILNQLKHLKDLGVLLSIDDFGTGYSNFEYLTQFSVDTIKIDRSFIKEITDSEDQHAIVVAIVNMAKALGLKIVAEGIETKTQLEVLQELECNDGQGFLWSDALPINKFLSYLDKEKKLLTKSNSSESPPFLTA